MVPPLVSLAVPIFGVARTLPQALESVLAQDEPRWECLLWDDGSRDGSRAIAAAYAARDPRFRLLGDGCNRGTAGALAAALQQARGDFVASLDGDDLLEPQALSAMLAFLHARPDLGMAYSQYREIDAGGGLHGLGPRCLLPYSPRHLLVAFMTFHFRLIRRGAYFAVGGYDPRARLAEDYDLCLRLSEQVGIGQLARPLYRYRVHAGSLSHTHRAQQVQASLAAARRALHRRGLHAHYQLELDAQGRHVLRPRCAEG